MHVKLNCTCAVCIARIEAGHHSVSIAGFLDFITKLFMLKVRPEVDSTIFKAVKFGLLITATSFVVVTARNYIGESINCTTGSGAQGDEIKAINSYCFITSTFTLSNLTLPNVSPHPGVGPIPHREFFPPGMQSEQILEEEETVTFHAYYQWVPFMLGLQGALLYIPTDLWRLKEDNYLERLLMDTHKVHVDKKDQKAKSKASAEAFHNSLGSNMKYLLWFIACEMLACAFSIANLFLTDAFLGGKFFDFGKGALSYLSGSVTDPNNPLNIVFPKTWTAWSSHHPPQRTQALDTGGPGSLLPGRQVHFVEAAEPHRRLCEMD